MYVRYCYHNWHKVSELDVMQQLLSFIRKLKSTVIVYNNLIWSGWNGEWEIVWNWQLKERGIEEREINTK